VWACRGGRAGESRTSSSGSPWNRKTRLCTKWCNTGSCPYGDRCNFAHGQHELKRLQPNNNSWDEEAMAQHQMGSMGGMLAMMQVRCAFPSHFIARADPFSACLLACGNEMPLDMQQGKSEAGRHTPSLAPLSVLCVRCVQGMAPMPPMMAAAHGNPKNSNYKTRICLNWHKTGVCQYENRCNFAHGNAELRPNYKDMHKVRHPLCCV